MRPDILFSTEQISLIILALLDDKTTFDQYQQENQTNGLVIKSMQSTTGSVLIRLEIKFYYTPPTQREASTPASQYELTIAYPRTVGAFKAVLVTLDVMVNTEWVHYPVRNLPFVLDKLHEYASS